MTTTSRSDAPRLSAGGGDRRKRQDESLGGNYARVSARDRHYKTISQSNGDERSGRDRRVAHKERGITDNIIGYYGMSDGDARFLILALRSRQREEVVVARGVYRTVGDYAGSAVFADPMSCQLAADSLTLKPRLALLGDGEPVEVLIRRAEKGGGI